jgi:hypothetical protein
MSTISNIKNWLNKPYPGPESYTTEVKGMLLAGSIVFLILFLFRPFGMGGYSGSALLMTLGFGAVTFIAGSLHNAVTRLLLKIQKDIESWRIKHWIVDTFFLIGLIGAGNYLYLLFAFGVKFSFLGLGTMLFNTILVGIIPLVILGYRNQLKLERRHNLYADSILEKEEKPSVENILLAVEAMQNYIQIYALKNGEFVKTTERKTLTSFLNESAENTIVKCHRSYLVNSTAVRKVTGNAQGLKLEMLHHECPVIPVSRSFISEIKLALPSSNESS